MITAQHLALADVLQRLGVEADEPTQVAAGILAELGAAGFVVAPIAPPEQVILKITRLWLLSDMEVTAGDRAEAAGYWRSFLSAAIGEPLPRVNASADSELAGIAP